MKSLVGIALLVFVIPTLQGALAPFLPTIVRPDFALLVVFGISLCWRNTAAGLLLAAACGFVVDLFSAGLLGQHALLAVLVFVAARLLSVHVSLFGIVSRMLFAAALTAGHALGLAALTAFFTPEAGFGLLRPGVLGLQILSNTLFAPLVTAFVALIAAWIAGEDTSRRLLRLETRGWAS